MKRIFEHPPELNTGKKYWRSVEELADTPQFREWLGREFPAGAAELETDGVTRRNFVQLMGASLALAGLSFAGCRRPESHFAAFSKSLEWSVPGEALYYTSAMPRRTGAMPLVVTTYDGRPTKIEGNPLHPASSGATDLHAQASILDLYNPERSRLFVENGKEADRAAFEKYFADLQPKLTVNGGAGLAFLLDVDHSPTRERLKKQILQKYPSAKWCVYDPTGSQAADAVTAAFGPGVTLNPQLDKADVLLALDADFLGTDLVSTEVTRQFAARRKADDGAKMNRLYAVENRYTITGGMADHRLRLKAGMIPTLTVEFARQIAAATGSSVLHGLIDGVVKRPLPVDPKWIEECVADLLTAKGRSLVLVGFNQPKFIQALGFAINDALGNLGQTLIGLPAAISPSIQLPQLAHSIQANEIQALFILGSNPVYSAPADLQFGEILKLVPEVVHLGMRFDETAQAAKWHLPGAHYLEGWSDGLSTDGTYVPVQPMIQPLFGGLSENDILALVAGEKIPVGAELVKATFGELAAKTGASADWANFLRNGYLAGSTPTPMTLQLQPLTFPALDPIVEGIEVVLPPDYKMREGAAIDNGWLQELPDPIHKLTWDNIAQISRKFATEHGIEFGDLIKISSGSLTLEVAVMVVAGHADDSITLTLGYGHEAGTTGKVGAGSGFNAYKLLTTANPYVLSGVKVEKLGKKYPLAITQEHNQMEGRALVREGTVEHFEENPEFAKTMQIDGHIPPNITIYERPALSAPEQWGMIIDLNACTGCNVCVVACQAENNIPIVGKEQVANSREMHWLRIDRYFATAGDEGDETEPEMVMQPLGCQHCENAPCEAVCPVNATVHSEDGLNVIAYNRCIGTRYCMNNCPFKVRRFNFFNYNERPIERIKIGVLPEASGLYYGPLAPKSTPELFKMQKNPNVTVRIRGVVEKCTYCVQRIEEARIKTRIKAGGSDHLKIPTNSVVSACMQACPAEAITFGDLKDEAGSAAKLQKNPRRYRLLEYLNLQPRTSFLARLRNPNPKMPGAAKVAAIYGSEAAAPAAETQPGGHS